MKRRLCTGIALIGNPDVLVLDEPSAGLDPLARRILWNALLRTMDERAMVLTTHSMNEAEVLCGRLGIMVEGQLRCIGSPQRLKSQYGHGYEVAIRLKEASAWRITKIVREFEKQHPGVVVLDEYVAGVTLLVPRLEMNVSKTFATLEALLDRHPIDFYGLNQSSLDTVFLDFAMKRVGFHFQPLNITNL
eukprot:FR737757.1.p1 GENE.FR737757.1~~FR737757.1.p1  ORF type:complete len:213 (+),score=17.10 FR737757.1:71-640(+)